MTSLPLPPPRRRSLALGALFTLACALGIVPVHAQVRPHEMPDRPRLAAAADTNDWEAYYDRGVVLLRGNPAEAEAAFHWASRLAPDRAEPLFARWVAFHMRDVPRFVRYLQREARVREIPAVVERDSVRRRAMLRNPFVHRGLEVVLYDKMPGSFRTDELTRGWIAYANAELPKAVTLMGRAIDRRPDRYRWVRATRAQAFVGMQQYDSAMGEMSRLLAELREQDERESSVYESKELLEYGVALLHDARGERDQARESMERALVENLAFYPARLWLGELALRRGSADEAAEQFTHAADLAAHDGIVQYRLGVARARAGQRDSAVAALQRAVAIEPWYAAPWLELGRSLEMRGDRAGARRAYEAYLKRAPRSEARTAAQIRSKVAALSGEGAG